MTGRVISLFPFVVLVLTAGSCSGTSQPSVTVIGKVSTYGGDPAAFLPILAGGQKATTDANGNFSVSGVTVPYDLAILEARHNRATIFQGLMRLEPIVFVPSSGANENKTDVTFNFTNLDSTPPPAGLFSGGYSGCASPEGYNLFCSSGLSPTTTEVSWMGKDHIRTTFFAVQTHSEPQGVAKVYLRFGKRENESLTNGVANSVNVALEPVVNKTLGGRVVVPAGYLLNDRGLGFKMSDVYTPVISRQVSEAGLSPDFTWASPDIPGVKLSLYASAKQGSSFVSAMVDDVAPDDANLEVLLPMPIGLDQPADNKLGVTNSTVFSWTPFADGVYGVSVYSENPNALLLTIFTGEPQTTLPDLRGLGFPLPLGITYSWMVFGRAPLASIDELVDGIKGIPTFPFARMAYTEQRIFTTTP